jgi:HAD superfamily hydrolase (TIGR01509 family)
MTDTPTDLIIFDLGRVLVDFDFEAVIRNLKKYTSLNEKQIRRYFEKTPLWDRFERGQVSPALFFKALSKDLKLKKLSYEKFSPLWNSIFTEKHDTVAVLRELRSRYRLAMLSNVNELHWEFIARQHAFMNWFDHPVASYAVGYRKPDAEIFRIVLGNAGVPPQRAVFIDDVESHIQAAKAIGMRAYRFVNATQLRRDLGEIL